MSGTYIDATPADEFDEWDLCDISFDTDKNTDDADIDALLLFADVEFTDPQAVAERAAEWQELFA